MAELTPTDLFIKNNAKKKFITTTSVKYAFASRNYKTQEELIIRPSSKM